ncbi:MAG: hypothetical protein WCS80_02120 [Bacilli bacterium]
MPITWFDYDSLKGSASLYNNNITLNTTATTSLKGAYKVKIGMTEEGNIAILPYTKERILMGDLDDELLLDIKFHHSYSRICSSAIMKELGSRLNLELGTEPLKFDTSWDNFEGALIIATSKGDN